MLTVYCYPAAAYDIREEIGGMAVNIIFGGVLCALLFVAAITVMFACEIHANNKRIRRGEAPKKHHDATDYEIVNVIDWTRH